MKGLFQGSALERAVFACLLSSLLLATPACRIQDPYPSAPGVLFIRQQICNLGDFKARFFNPSNALASHGFQSYCFYRDRRDPKTYLLVFSCADLEKAGAFLQNSNFTVSCVGAGLGEPLMWAGSEVEGRPEAEPAPGMGGLVLTRLEVRDYAAWKKGWEVGKAMKDIRLYRMESRSHEVVLTQEVPDIRRSPEGPDVGEGVTWREIWIGTYLEAGKFNPLHDN